MYKSIKLSDYKVTGTQWQLDSTVHCRRIALVHESELCTSLSNSEFADLHLIILGLSRRWKQQPLPLRDPYLYPYPKSQLVKIYQHIWWDAVTHYLDLYSFLTPELRFFHQSFSFSWFLHCFNILLLSFRGVQSLFCFCVSATSQKSIYSRKTVHVCSFSFSFNAVGLFIPSYEESNQLALQLSHKDIFRNALCPISLHLYLGQGLCAVPSFCIHQRRVL